MSAHTPGPWTASLVGPLPRPIKIGSTNAFRISPLAGPGFCYLPEGRQDIQEANARLIAAAPELFEALKDLAGWANLSETHERSGALAAKVNAAIAKAEGGS